MGKITRGGRDGDGDGPTTIPPDESAKALLERMEKRNIEAVVVSTKKGLLAGVGRSKICDEW